MYTLTFNEETILDLWDHHSSGRQFFGALVAPYSGLFTNPSSSFYTELPKILCPYQINDIIIIQERWAKTTSSGYIYEISDSYATTPATTPTVGGHEFLPAYTMPDDAARMYGRIVSITPWLVNGELAKKYLPSGLNIDNWSGTAKVIGNTDVGTRLLNKTRKRYNTEALNKTYQPVIKTTDPPIIRYVPYQLYRPVHPYLHFLREDLPTTVMRDVFIPSSNYTDSAQARTNLIIFSDPSLYNDPLALKSGQPISEENSSYDPTIYAYDAWALYPEPLTIKQANVLQNSGVNLYQRGLAKSSPTTDRTSESATFIYILLDEQRHAIPILEYYPTETIDSNQKVFAWLISGYLCEKDGTILGNLF